MRFFRWIVLISCGSPPPPAPSAVITLAPAAVCIGDNFQTEIQLDSKGSAARLTLVPAPPDPNAPPLKLKWSFSGSAFQIGGDPTRDHTIEDSLTVTMAGDRPLHVTLHVENEVGGTSEAIASIAVTPLDENGNCPLPSP